jgi:tape measure domain-containing protein
VAGDRMRFIFELEDKASKPAGAIAAAIRSAERALVPMAKVVPRADNAVQSFVGNFVKLKGFTPFVVDPLNAAMKVFGGLSDAALSTASAIASVSFDMGRFAVETLAFKESTLTSFRLMLGTEEAASRVFDQAVKFAARTPLETEEVVRGFKQLLSAGFTEQQLPVMFQALGDIHAASGFNPEVIPRVVAQFAQIQGMNRVTMEDLRSITNWTAQAGVGVQQIWAGIAKRMGTSVEQVAAMQHAGTLGADAFFGGFLEAVATKGGGKVGGVMEAAADDLMGLWSTVKSIPADTLLSMDMKGLEGWDALKGTLVNVRELFGETSESAKRVREVVRNSFNSVFTQLFGDFAGPEGLTRIETIIRGVTRGFEIFVAVVRSGLGFASGLVSGFADGMGLLDDNARSLFDGPLDAGRVELMVGQFKAFGTQLGHDLGVIAQLAERVLALFDRLGSAGKGAAPFLSGAMQFAELIPGVGGFAAMWNQAGQQSALSYAQGLADKADAARAGGDQVGAEGEGGLRERIDAHSPSRVFQELGAFSAEGFRLGLEGGLGPILDGFGAGGLGSPGTVAAASGGGTGGRSISVVFGEGAIAIDARGQDGAALAKALREQLLSELSGAFETLAIETGVA